MWDRLGEDVDVLVVGGGITGAGIARDAVRRGLKVALVEMHDFAYGTSSRSSKLVHGGLRYLEQYEFAMVFESVSERRTLMNLAPHLVNPLAFLFPVYEGTRHNLRLISAGMWLYDGLSLFRSPKTHQNLKPAAIAELEPGLRQKGLKGAPLYYDCSTDDARLTLETHLDAAKHGAIVCNRAKVETFLKDESGKIIGADIRDTREGGETKRVHAKVVINATGPWSDRTRELSPCAGVPNQPVLRPTKGIHIVVASQKLPVGRAVVCIHPDDERVLFALPWGDRTYIGTTDTDYQGRPEDVAATSEDVDYLIEVSNTYFPNHQIAREDIISTWAGLRPLVAPPSSGLDESAVSREHEILVGRDGLVTIAGGKLTTYRKMAAEVVEVALKELALPAKRRQQLRPSFTARDPLPGGVGWSKDDDHAAMAKRVLDAGDGHLSEEVAAHLANTYGTRGIALAHRVAQDPSLAAPLVEGRPEIVAQVDWAVNEEFACTVADVLVRRTQLFFRDHNQGLGCAPAVAERMAGLLDWNEAQTEASLEDYRAEVALARAWKDEQ